MPFVATIVFLLVLSNSTGLAQTAEARCSWPADAVRLSAKDLQARIRHRAEPKLDGNICIEGSAVFRILIAPDGSVECTVPVKRLPEVGPAALEAVQQYRFEPVVVDGRRAHAIGVVVVDCSWDRARR